jgi:hypothetical protein
MTDDDIDARLRDHGTTWRAANHDRPGIDWDTVTKPRSTRTLFGVVGVSVAAAAIVVPLVITAGGHSASPPVHRPHPSSTSTHITMPHGVGLDFYGLTAHRVNVVYLATPGHKQNWFSNSEGGGRPRALGVAPDDANAYAAFPSPHCTTSIQHFTLNGILGGDTVPGGQPATAIDGAAMAVSPDSKKLALVVDAPTPASVHLHKKGCFGPQELEVLNLVTHKVREWAAPTQDAIRSLQWSPDSRHVAYLTARACAFLSYSSSVCGDDPQAGTRVLDITAPGRNLEAPRLLLPAFGTGNGYGPAFWWHGELVTSFGGVLRVVYGQGGLGDAIATGFPQQVVSVSSDPTGDHLLLTTPTSIYRWDSGKLSGVHGQWTQPGW